MDLILYYPQYNMIIFNLNNEYELSIEILLNFYKEEYINYYFQKFIANGFLTTIKEFIPDNDFIFKIKSTTSNEIKGIAYKIRDLNSKYYNSNIITGNKNKETNENEIKKEDLKDKNQNINCPEKEKKNNLRIINNNKHENANDNKTNLDNKKIKMH